MRRAARRATVSTASVPAPVGGLNARDSIADMAPTDAIVMDNWVPGTTSIAIRKGFESWCSGFSHPVETVMAYNSSASNKLFAISNGSIYDSSLGGTAGSAMVSGLGNSRFQHANFGTAGGQFLYAVNGADDPRLWNGTTWTAINGASTPAITGVTTNLLKDVQVYGRRLWFVEKASFRVWYLPIDSIGGAAQSIDLSELFILGGELQGMVVWTVASELSTTDYALFISSEGEAAIYAGNNPASADTWALTGTFRIGKPIGQRFWTRVGTDTVMITQDGLIPASKASFMNRQSQSDAISYKITNLLADDTSFFQSQFGWQVMLYPKGNKLICNSPRDNASDNIQYVMNTITNQWCRYRNIASYCWTLFDDEPYFGGDTAVYKAETGSNDNANAIQADVIPAYSYFGAKGVQKLFTAVRPIITANGKFKPSVGISTDFNVTPPSSTPTLSLGGIGATWDVSLWDVSFWEGVYQTAKDWQSIGGLGFAAALRMQSASKDMDVAWISTDFVYEVARSGFY